jgi:hypothetical protein
MQALRGHFGSLHGQCQPKGIKAFQVSHKTAQITSVAYTLVFVPFSVLLIGLGLG